MGEEIKCDLYPPLWPFLNVPFGEFHPGSFGVNRHLHVHTGVDLYAPHGAPVAAMEDGVVIKICWFTGPSVNMPWWNDTRAVYIEGETGVFNYGEIQEYPDLKVGDSVKRAEYFGYVVPVLKKYKGRPMSMLHLELYDHGYTDTWGEWKIGDSKPEHLKDPTPYLLAISKKSCSMNNFLTAYDDYTDSSRSYSCRKDLDWSPNRVRV